MDYPVIRENRDLICIFGWILILLGVTQADLLDWCGGTMGLVLKFLLLLAFTENVNKHINGLCTTIYLYVHHLFSLYWEHVEFFDIVKQSVGSQTQVRGTFLEIHFKKRYQSGYIL